jgi:hypothetical protein
VNSGRRISLTVTRLRLAPGARFDWEFAGPILFIVETGELALEAARATIIERATNEDPVRAPGGMTPIAGGRAMLPAPNSAFTEDGPSARFGTSRTKICRYW